MRLFTLGLAAATAGCLVSLPAPGAQAGAAAGWSACPTASPARARAPIAGW